MMNSANPRLPVVDMARGMALIAMTLFHFGWDLEMFGIAERGFAAQPAMVWFARCIASSFLALVGVSLVLAHHDGVQPLPFAKRMARILAAAALISIATWYATPDIFIFFGILHHIALASVLGLAFVRLPAMITLAAAVAVLLLGLYGRSDVFDAPWWWWSGLNAFTPRSSDYVPIFPFFAAVLVGMAVAQTAMARGWSQRLSAIDSNAAPGRVLKFIGRHSLLYYLLHQPIMIGLLFAFQYMFQLFVS